MTFKFTTAQWAKDPKVAAAWRELAQQHGLHPAEFADVDIDRVFGFLDAFLLMSYPVQYRYVTLTLFPPISLSQGYTSALFAGRLAEREEKSLLTSLQ